MTDKSSPTAQDFYKDIVSRLRSCAIETPEIEAKILMEDIGGVPYSQLMFNADIKMPSPVIEEIKAAVQQRKEGKPLGRILGYRDFWKHRFYLSPETLEPRPDTETLIEAALKSCQPSSPASILDLGTGTGCILLSLLAEFPQATGIGVDIAKGACFTAQKNAERLNLADRCQFLCGSWTNPLPKGTKFDVITSNPPYVPTADIANLQENVRKFDPILALDGGITGLDPYTNLLSNLKNYLHPMGRIFLEFGIGQAEDIKRLATNSGATLIRVTKDLGGVERVVEISYGDK